MKQSSDDTWTDGQLVKDRWSCGGAWGYVGLVASKLCLVATRSLRPAGCCARGRNLSMLSFIRSVSSLGSALPLRRRGSLGTQLAALCQNTPCQGGDGEWLCKVNISQSDGSADSKHSKAYIQYSVPLSEFLSTCFIHMFKLYIKKLWKVFTRLVLPRRTAAYVVSAPKRHMFTSKWESSLTAVTNYGESKWPWPFVITKVAN